MASKDAAPMLCGSWTVWNALVGYDPKPTSHIGIVGIGGLGHLAIQFANKMGCEVTALSSNENKRAEVTALGAHQFVVSKGAKEFMVARQINRLLITANSHIDCSLYLPVLTGRVTVFPLQIPEDKLAPLSVPHIPYMLKSINIIYSTNGPHDACNKMLSFATLHNIRPVIEKFLMSTECINESIERLESGKMRYLGVLVVWKRLEKSLCTISISHCFD